MVFQANPYSVLLVSASEKLNTAVLPLFPGSDFWPVTVVGSLSRAKRLLLQQSYDLVVLNTPLPDGMGTDFAMKLCSETDAAVALLIRSELYEETNAKALPAGVVVVSKPTNSQLLTQVIAEATIHAPKSASWYHHAANVGTNMNIASSVVNTPRVLKTSLQLKVRVI